MKEHKELFEKEYARARALLEGDDMDLVLYCLVGGLKALLSSSEDGKISAKEIAEVFAFSTHAIVKRSEQKRAKRGVSE